MAKGKRTDKRPARAAYKLSGKELKNKNRHKAAEEKRVAFFSERNRVNQQYNLGKANAKRVVRMIRKGIPEAEAISKVATQTNNVVE